MFFIMGLSMVATFWINKIHQLEAEWERVEESSVWARNQPIFTQTDMLVEWPTIHSVFKSTFNSLADLQLHKKIYSPRNNMHLPVG